MSDDPQHTHRQRDAEALTIIGAFFAILAALVLIGVIMHHEGGDAAVGIGAGIILLVIGLGSVSIGRRLRRGPS